MNSFFSQHVAVLNRRAKARNWVFAFFSFLSIAVSGQADATDVSTYYVATSTNPFYGPCEYLYSSDYWALN